MVASGAADAMVTGLTRSFQVSFGGVRHVLPSTADSTPCGVTLSVNRNQTVFVADTTVNERPGPEQLADIATAAAGMARNMGAEPRVALLYPFARLSGPANVLVMPSLHAANISAKMLQMLGGGAVIGPVLLGLSKPVQIVRMGAKVSEIVNMAVFAAHAAQARPVQ